MEEEDINEACGVFGCVASGRWPTSLEVSNIICSGLVGLQHRGQESAGIVTTAGQQGHPFFRHKGMGLVSQIFTDEAIRKLRGNLGIGHNRYSTSGTSELSNCQPFVVETCYGLLAVAHNGELVNAKSLRRKVLQHGIGLSSMSDTELIAQILCSNVEEFDDEPDWAARIRHLMKETPCSYSMLVMHGDAIYAARDPFGNRPLCLGELLNSSGGESPEFPNDGWVVSSESCSFQSIGARYYREILPGEIVRITKDGVKSMCVVPRPHSDSISQVNSAFCIFEYVYFARADSVIEGQMVYSVRKRCGMQLAREAPAVADLVSTVPESATPAAFGYSEESGLPYVEVLCKNRYVGRTFIQPSNRLRRIGVAKKFGALVDNVRGKRIVLLDDSIVRGNTMRPIVSLLKSAGAAEVHIRVASPPIKHPCYMGINIPTTEELVANRLNPKQLAEFVGADSLEYLSIEGLVKSVQSGIEDAKEKNIGHCTACLTGNYPTELEW